ncbi:MAG: NAD(P)-binding protein [Microthrixaceae bacterium]
MTDSAEILIVGAGLSGLVAAAALGKNHSVRLIEKGRGVGGRMATRRIGEATFDHGAQFFTTHTSAFAKIVADWVEAGFATPWFSGGIGAAGGIESSGIAEREAHSRFRGRVSMNDIAKNLASAMQSDAVQILSSTRASSVVPADSGWVLLADTGQEFFGDVVFLTSPVPQTLELLNVSGVQLRNADRDALESICYDPCLAVLAPLTGPSGLPFPGARHPGSGPIEWIADNSMKGISAAEGVTIHATAEFSRQHFDSADSEVIDALVHAAGLDSPAILELCQLQKWRYAKPTVLHPDPYLLLDAHAPLVCAGDCFGGAKVEGAVLSGLAAAAAVEQILQAR